MRFVTEDHRHLRRQAEEFAHAAEVQDQVLIDGDAPIFEQFQELGILCRRLVLAEAHHVVEHDEFAAATFFVGLEGGNGGGGIVELWASHEEHGAVFGNLDGDRGGRLADSDRLAGVGCGGSEIDRLDGVVIPLLQLFQEGVTAVAFVVDAVFPGGVQDADIARAGLERTDQRAGNFFLGKALGGFFADAAIHHDGGIGAETKGLRLGRLAFRVDVFHVESGGERGIAVQKVAGAGEGFVTAEVSYVDIVFQIVDHFNGLVREAELLVGGGIPRLIVAVRQEIHAAQDRQNYGGVSDGIRPVLGLSCLDPFSSHVRTSTAAIPWIAQSGKERRRSWKDRRQYLWNRSRLY